jgi:predicted DCC family thiol-disulfide oxidoreductase YuxK
MTPALVDRSVPLLLYNGECAVCRAIAAWVAPYAHDELGASTLAERPIGDDPAALAVLNPTLDIWDAYETIHMLMPDGTMKLGGEAVAEVFRRLPITAWFTWAFAVSIFGVRPFQAILNFGYLLLSDVRPLLGCESCGTPNVWVRSIRQPVAAFKRFLGAIEHPSLKPHFSAVSKK